MNLKRTKSNVLASYLLIVLSMYSVTSRIEKCYCVIITVGGELKCKINTGGDCLEQSGNESTPGILREKHLSLQ